MKRFSLVNKTLLAGITLSTLLLLMAGCMEKELNNPFDPNNEAQVIPAPTFSLASGTYNVEQVTAISCTMNGVTIRYTSDGSEPNSNSTVYTAPLGVAGNTTLKAKAYKDGWDPSGITTETYNFQLDTPVFSPEDGVISSGSPINISCQNNGTTIRYTTDGSEPNIVSTLYTTPIYILEDTLLKAKAFKQDWLTSQTATADYTIVPLGFAYFPAGTFAMGDTRGLGYDDELPTHSVTLNSFYIGKYEVTQSEFQAIMGSNPATGYGVGTDYPVYYVSWYSILKYCNLRSIAEGLTPVYSISGSTNPASWGAVPSSNNTTWNQAICNWSDNGYRLPTEAEWEYAARAATDTPDYLYSGSDDVNTVAWYSSNSTSTSHLVGTKAANALCIYDMSGNEWEWCWDWYGGYNSNSVNNPTGPTTGSSRLLRGGGWSGSATNCRVSYRYYGNPCYSSYYSGFRLCRATN